ncbi:MAG: tRNA (adenosine(37)-N6)-dimethylallyltransferase MiaA [Desulfurobacteriaceae bacterium]
MKNPSRTSRTKDFPLIVITGPTATGKTDFSIKLAREIGGEIISADSMQVYKGLDIGTDKVSKDIRKEIPHYLIDIVEPNQRFSVADFVREAEKAIEKIKERKKFPIVVGGTGFYIKALLYGLPQTPPADETLREELSKLSDEELFRKVEKISPEYARKVGETDRKRLIRALEVYRLTGKPITAFGFPESPRYDFFGYFLYRNRPELYRRIEDRVDSQIKRGLIRETEWLLSFGKNTTALQALGYKEMIPYLEGRVSLEESAKLLKRRTKEFAKRQFTWFRKEPGFKWVNLSEVPEEELIQLIKKDIEDFSPER